MGNGPAQASFLFSISGRIASGFRFGPSGSFAVWSVAYSHPNQERKAVSHVSNLGLDIFFPRIQTRKVVRGTRQWIEEPLFPRYFFVCVADQWRSLLSAVGVAGVIMSGDKPANVPEKIVSDIKHRCNRDGVYVPYRFRFQTGQRVRVERGALKGHFGIYRGMRSEDRADVLINMLGAMVHASFLEGDLIEA
jgi:transcriptional antiterminator RfaH